MGKDFQLTVHDDRAAEYQRIFGTDTVYVKSPMAEIVTLEGTGERQSVYMLDLSLYDDLTHDRLVSYIARKFNADEADVTKELGERGLPIQAKNATLTVLHPMKWLPNEMESPTPSIDDEPADEDFFDAFYDDDDGEP